MRVRCEGDLENAMKFTECERQSESGAEDEGESTDADVSHFDSISVYYNLWYLKPFQLSFAV